MLLEHALFARAWEGETLFTKTFWTGEEGGEGKEAENSPGRLQRSAHGLFIWRISAGDLRAGLRDETDWQTVNCESDRRMEFRGRRLRGGWCRSSDLLSSSALLDPSIRLIVRFQRLAGRHGVHYNLRAQKVTLADSVRWCICEVISFESFHLIMLLHRCILYSFPNSNLISHRKRSSFENRGVLLKIGSAASPFGWTSLTISLEDWHDLLASSDAHSASDYYSLLQNTSNKPFFRLFDF